MQRLFILSLLIIVIAFSCKKKENTPEPSPSTTGSVPTTTVAYSGFISGDRNIFWSNGNIVSTSYGSTGYLYAAPTVSVNVLTSSNEGTIIANGITLKFDNSIFNYYRDTTGSLNFTSQRSFQLLSSGTLPSFTYNNPDTIPVYSTTNMSLINDTLFKSQNLIIPLNTVNYHNEVDCFLNQTSPFIFLSKTVPAGATSITFTPTELSAFTTGNSIYCTITLKKYNTQSLGGKYFRFESNCVNNFFVMVQN